jgi:TRAP-type C4-dicarboxylate transport system permease small subunit
MDRAWARGEGWLTVAVLILMVLVAGFQAGVRNLTRFDIQWANDLLTDMDWADSLLRKGTLWLAFLGASLAAHHHKHINIDPLLRIAPPKAKYTMLAIGVFIAGLICIALTYSFSTAVYLNLTERPVEYEMLAPGGGSMHLCDATDAQLAELVDAEKPAIFCVFRSLLGVIGIPAETPGAAFQLIVPLMFAIMALRFLAQGIGYGLIVAGGTEAVALADAEEKRRELAQQADSTALRPEDTGSGQEQPK